MDPFGPFEAGRELESGHGSTVFKAQKVGDPKGDYVIKLFSPGRMMPDEPGETGSQRDPLFKDTGGSLTSLVNLQNKAAQSSPHFVPILASGDEERGAWYAARYYPRSVKGMLDRLVALENVANNRPNDAFAQASLLRYGQAQYTHMVNLVH